jgi:putative endonuclease
MVDSRRIFGDGGEEIAEKFLVEKGYEILDRQFLTRLGEIDLVAKDGDEVVFVEVKIRRDTSFGYPEESVTPSKLRKIAMTAELYLRTHYLLGSKFRIDVVAILLNQTPPEITHLIGVG